MNRPEFDYNIQSFSDWASSKTKIEVVSAAISESNKAEQESFGFAGCIANRNKGSMQYSAYLKSLVFFLDHGIKPEMNFSGAFAPIIEHLSTTGQIPDSFLAALES